MEQRRPRPRQLNDSFYYIRMVDNGHTKICPSCCFRFGFDQELSGKPRNLTMEICEKCVGRGITERALRLLHGGASDSARRNQHIMQGLMSVERKCKVIL